MIIMEEGFIKREVYQISMIVDFIRGKCIDIMINNQDINIVV